MHQTPVSEIMTREVISIDPDLPVREALELMGANDVRRLPVVSRAGRIVGIITISDARLAMPRPDDLDATPPKVREVMTDYVYTIAPEGTVGEAARLMVNHRIAALPVLEEGDLVGIVTESDLFRFVAEQMHPEGEGA